MTVMEARKRPLWRRVVHAIGIVGLALFLIVMAWRYVEAKRLSHEIAKIKAVGEPLTFNDLDVGQPKIVESDDAGPYYEAALALVRHRADAPLWDARDRYRETVRHSPTSRPSDEIAERVHSLLADNALAMEMLDRGARLPGCSFDTAVEQGMEASLERLGRARAAARLLSARAWVRASQGQGDEAVDSLVSLVQLHRAFDRRPVLIAFLVKIACLSLACDDAGIIIGLSQPSDAALARLGAALQSADQPKLLERMLLAERVYALQLLRQMVAGGDLASPGAGSSVAPSEWGSSGFWAGPIPDRMATSALREFAEIVNLGRKPLPEALEGMKLRGPSSSTVGKLLAPPMEKAFLQAARMSAEARSASVAISVERYRRACDRLPETLTEIVPEYANSLPADPFSGKNLLYRHDASHFIVYSPGEDGKDDGGDVVRPDQGKRPPDVGTRVDLPAGR